MDFMKPILHWWCNGNIKSAVNAINQYVNAISDRINEPSILLDALSMCCQSSKFSSMPIDYAPQLVEKARTLIESKYTSHVRGGLDFVYRVF